MVDITKIKSEITLDIFGEGNQKKYLEGLVDEYGLANYVFLRGEKPEHRETATSSGYVCDDI